MNEKQRTKRIRHELDKAKAELARQDAELEALESEMDPEELARAEKTFAKALRRVERRDQPQPAKVPTFALRV
jgi:predicted  nucleic acid-binding Zn-ribbon protein